MIYADPSEGAIVKHLFCGMSWQTLKLFYSPSLVVTILLAFASRPAHTQGILVPRDAVWNYFGMEDTAGNTIAPNSRTNFSLVPYVPADVGGPGIAGSVSLSAGTYTLTGGGSEIG